MEGGLEVPRRLARRVHYLYLNPQNEEFQPRTMWSLSNAFTSAFKELDPIPQGQQRNWGAFLKPSAQRLDSGGFSPARRGIARWFGFRGQVRLERSRIGLDLDAPQTPNCRTSCQ